LSYQGLEEGNLDRNSPGPPGWGLMQRASSSLITKKQEMLKKTKHIFSAPYYIVICGLSDRTVFFPHYLINGTIFGNKIIEHKTLTFIFFKTSV